MSARRRSRCVAVPQEVQEKVELEPDQSLVPWCCGSGLEHLLGMVEDAVECRSKRLACSSRFRKSAFDPVGFVPESARESAKHRPMPSMKNRIDCVLQRSAKHLGEGVRGLRSKRTPNPRVEPPSLPRSQDRDEPGPHQARNEQTPECGTEDRDDCVHECGPVRHTLGGPERPTVSTTTLALSCGRVKLPCRDEFAGARRPRTRPSASSALNGHGRPYNDHALSDGAQAPSAGARG